MNLNQPIQINKSRWAALGLLFGLLAVLYWVVAAPLIGMAHEYNESVDELQFRLRRLSKVAAEKEPLAEGLERIKSEGLQDERFLARNTAALASADLQTQIKAAVSEAGGELTSTQVIPERNEQGFTRVAVKVRMNGSTKVLRQALHSFESATPLLFVENLNIRPIRMPRNPNAKNPQVPDRLSVDFDVVGYMRAQ